MSDLQIQNLLVQAGGFRVGPLTIQVPSGSYTVVLGPSGSGKSLFLETLAGHHAPADGRIVEGGVDITNCPPHKRPISLMHQGLHLFPHLTGYWNIAYGWRPDPDHPDRDMCEDIGSLCDQMGIFHLRDHFPRSFSGGEAQRVALARSIVTRPSVLLLDEPLAALDTSHARELIVLLKRIHASGLTILHVTHDYRECLALADRVAVLHEGALLQEGPVSTVFSQPNHPFLARLTGRTNAFFGQVEPTGGPVNGTFRVQCGAIPLIVAGHAPEAGQGLVSFRPEDVVVSSSEINTSALNVFAGTVRDLVKNESGLELTINAGLSITAQLTERSVNDLDLHPGSAVQVAIKASAIQFTGGTA